VHFLVTGHTGFKGSWLTLMLSRRGHQVSGLALDPEPGALFTVAGIGALMANDVRCDIRGGAATVEAITSIAPDVIIHMAAQPLVRASYVDPRWTMETNVMGTLSVLEAVSAAPSLRAAVMVTTDKVYRNVGQLAGYVESDPLGGHDPYSASKAMADLLVSSWVDSFSPCPTATARAGNVIGGGDVSADRLFPDLLRGFAAGVPVQIRNPHAVRPWQHVLDCLNGYLLLADALLAGRGEGAWNFGPDPRSFRTVAAAADRAVAAWGPGAAWTPDTDEHPHEAQLLTLDSSKSRERLGWMDRLGFDEAVDWTVDWDRRVSEGQSPMDVAVAQIDAFDALVARVQS
jgi:CDP-glucose 4,6-dehydratase